VVKLAKIFSYNIIWLPYIINGHGSWAVVTLSCGNYVVLIHGSEIITFRAVAETMITPEQFAEVLCDDLDLPSSSFSAAIASSIRQQCEQFPGDMIPDDEEDRRVIIKVHTYVHITLCSVQVANH
jgi:hypothetical protein